MEGVKSLTCFPANALIDATAAATVRPVVARPKQVSVNIAGGYSRISNGRRIGVCAV